jgi:hypothetical protein
VLEVRQRHAVAERPLGRAGPDTEHHSEAVAAQRDPRWRIEQLTGTLANGDSDKEYWKVTTPDGVQYFFGLGVKPEAANAATNSVYTVPVMGNHNGEACRGNATGNFTENFCKQGWRWNLDRVVDPNGNVTTYTYVQEVNYYKVALGLWGWQSYTRAGRLRFIEYGGNTGAAAPRARSGFREGFGSCPTIVDDRGLR